MNILSKLSIRNLKLNKKRTISTIIGIILSVALICAVASMGISFQATLVENAINETGYYHLKISDVTDENIESLKNNRDIKDVLTISEKGYGKLENSQNVDKPYFKLYSMDKKLFEFLKFNLIDGRFPTNNNEIIISEHIIENAKVNYKIGDKIKVNIGERVTLDDDKLYYMNPYNKEDEKLINTQEYEFTIVGIIERPNMNFEAYSDPGYTIISTNMEAEKQEAYITLKNPKEYKKSIPNIVGASSYDSIVGLGENADQKLKYDNYQVNDELLRWEAFAFSDSTVNMLYAVIGVVIFIIIFASVFCIRNSFAIATTEKMKMYSMLASVGATKKQIKKNVIFEGLLLGVVGIPLGIISGFFAVFVLLQIVNNLLGEQLLAHVDGIVFKISILPILLSVILGIITIYLSARSSAKRASKVSQIEGLRNSSDIKIKNKNLKVPKIISKIFKTGGVLAYKNLKRNKKKYRTTVISISISIFIFITMNSFITNMFDLTNNYYEDYNYNLLISGDLKTEEIKKIVSNDTVESYSILYNTDGTYKIKNLDKIIANDSYPVTEIDGEAYTSLQIVALDSSDFKEYAKRIKVNYEDVKNAGILCDEYQIYDETSEKQKEVRRYKYEKGDTIEGEYKNEKLKIKVGAVSQTKPDGIEKTYYSDGFLVVDKEQFKNLNFRFDVMTIQSNNATSLQKEIDNINKNTNVYNIEETAKQEKSMALVIKIFLYGFIAVITLIGVTNIFNTITSNMELRQKEFAMLKSIGMTKKEFNRMINLETIFYGVKSWVYGTILGLLGTFAMYKAFSVKIEQGIYIPINAIIISAIFVFIFVFIIMRYSISKINKQNTIETIRNENI
ncbi:MAG: FtsX-like permease family protein [Clostridia bacterium]|nr:FtsX-like permease family protein [Clostridia bacterium]